MASLAAWACFYAPVGLAAEAKNVLVLYSNNRLLPANIEIERGISDTLASTPEQPVEFFAEFLDVPRFAGQAYARTVATYLFQKYVSRPPDVIVVGGEEALAFLLSNRPALFPRTPVVHVGVQASFLRSAGTMPPDVVGVPVEYSSAQTVEQALTWHPDVKHLVVVTGSSPWDRQWETRLRDELSPLQRHMTVEFLAGLSTATLLNRLRELEGHAVVFTPGYFQDGAGRIFVPRQSVELMAGAATAPVYGPSETYLGTGIVGGFVPSHRAMGRQAGVLVDEILRGNDVGALSVPASTPTELHVDWRQARRWGIREAEIPTDAVVHFRMPTLWEQYRSLVLATIAVFSLQAGLIVALLLERKRRRRTAATLEEAQREMTLASSAAGLSMWVWDLVHGQFRVAERKLAGAEPSKQIDQSESVLDLVHPADRALLENSVRRAIALAEPLYVEYRVLRPGEPAHWLALRGGIEPGARSRCLGVAIDVTARKVAEMQASKDRAALRHMTRISVLGQLSASIAHQLNQPLAAILSNAEAAQEMLTKSQVDIVELRAICNDIIAEDHRAADVIVGLRALFKRGELELRPLDMNALVQDTLSLMKTDLMMRHVMPVTDLAIPLPAIDGDRIQLQQVLLNLLINAADAMSTTEGRSRTLTIRTDVVGVDVRLRVSDSGPGIPDADFKTLFDAFWTTKPEGIGIGLAICHSIVATHNGRLSAANNPEGGATFSAIFPRRASA